jgi:hypothetical protein
LIKRAPYYCIIRLYGYYKKSVSIKEKALVHAGVLFEVRIGYFSNNFDLFIQGLVTNDVSVKGITGRPVQE